MTIQERLKRSNLIMLIVPVVIAGVLLALGLSVLVLLLQNIYLPQLGLTLRDLHDMGEQAEKLLSGLKLFIVLYAVVVLIAGMSHDLKSPLTIIRAYTEALLEGIARDEAARQRYLQTIYAKETDLEALINRLFELAKLRASEYPVHLRTLSLQEALQKILREGEYEGLLIRCDAISDVRVTADYELLNRIFHNLADNSCKYGASTLTFATFRLPAFLLGIVILLGLEGVKKAIER